MGKRPFEPVPMGIALGGALAFTLLFGLTMRPLAAAFLIPIIPFTAFAIVLVMGWWLKATPLWTGPLKEGGTLVLLGLATSFGLSLFLWGGHAGDLNGHEGTLSLGTWLPFKQLSVSSAGVHSLSTGAGGITVGVYVDHLSLLLTTMASFLCTLICWFSLGYMNTDRINENRLHRFYAAFSLFACGMLGMVLADSFIFLFIFWEIMGLCSYLLIGFYWERPSAAYAAKKAFLTTRVGDVFLMIGLVVLYNLFGTTSISLIFEALGSDGSLDISVTALRWALVCLFIGAVGKSAQFPLHVWLPDAMEGPTPVSALIHAATMVNAGLYLVARMFPFFESHALQGELLWVAILIATIGGITAVMAALIALVQVDIKKVLAYSTMSQLAYIFTGLGAALWLANEGQHHEAAMLAMGAAMFHLLNHALAKGMLFMASGSVIHEMHHAEEHLGHCSEDEGHGHQGHAPLDPQDMRDMGGLARRMPITSLAMLIGSASIIGLPFIGGFHSKEGIIASAFEAGMAGGSGTLILIPAVLILLTAGLTGFYMSRMWLMTFAGVPKTEVAAHVEETTPWIPTPLITLSVLSLGGVVFASMEMVAWLGEGQAFALLLAEPFLWLVPAHGLEFWVIGLIAVALSTFIGPFIAMRAFGGERITLAEERPTWLRILQAPMAGVLALSASRAARNRSDLTRLSESRFGEALRRRLYFDEWYDAFSRTVVVGFARLSRWVDERGVDGAIKAIEAGSQGGSTWIRRVTSGSARDYILFVAIGTVGVFLLLLTGVA